MTGVGAQARESHKCQDEGAFLAEGKVREREVWMEKHKGKPGEGLVIYASQNLNR